MGDEMGRARDDLVPGEKGYKFKWLDEVQRARVAPEEMRGRHVKWHVVEKLASRLAHYANDDGTGIRPGNPRLLSDLDTGRRSLQYGLGFLREKGMVEQVCAGKSRPVPRAAEYELRHSDWLSERLPDGVHAGTSRGALASPDKVHATTHGVHGQVDGVHASTGRGALASATGCTPAVHPTNQLTPSIFTNHLSPANADADSDQPAAAVTRLNDTRKETARVTLQQQVEAAVTRQEMQKLWTNNVHTGALTAGVKAAYRKRAKFILSMEAALQ